MTVLTKNPSSDNTTQLNKTGASNFGDVADASDTSFVYNNATAVQRDLYGLDGGTIPSGATINKVTAFYRVRMESFLAGGSTSGAARIKTHDTEYFGTTGALTTSWVNKSYEWLVNPNTLSAWTSDEITALLAGPALTTSDINRKMGECAKFYIEVDYTVGGPLVKWWFR